jgi:hypothetical protein
METRNRSVTGYVRGRLVSFGVPRTTSKYYAPVCPLRFWRATPVGHMGNICLRSSLIVALEMRLLSSSPLGGFIDKKCGLD